MKGKSIFAVAAVVLVLGLVLAGTALAQGPQAGDENGVRNPTGGAYGNAYGWVDANGDGINDRSSGICDGTGWVDEDGDGINDNCTDGACVGVGIGMRAGGGYGQSVGAQNRSQLQACDGECDGTEQLLQQQRLGSGRRGAR
ncbi:MAG: hypothetical protein LLG44_03900 [Chloroflexi bacterium]|nr:hypothetical protein [Chloroflexota bacterium]